MIAVLVSLLYKKGSHSNLKQVSAGTLFKRCASPCHCIQYCSRADGCTLALLESPIVLDWSGPALHLQLCQWTSRHCLWGPLCVLLWGCCPPVDAAKGEQAWSLDSAPCRLVRVAMMEANEQRILMTRKRHYLLDSFLPFSQRKKKEAFVQSCWNWIKSCGLPTARASCTPEKAGCNLDTISLEPWLGYEPDHLATLLTVYDYHGK